MRTSIMYIELFVFIQLFLSSCCKCELNKRDVQLSKMFLNITNQDLENAIQYGTQQINMLSCVENMISCAKVHDKTVRPSYGQQIDAKLSQEENVTYSNAEILIHASQYIMSKYCLRYGISKSRCAKKLVKVRLDQTSLGKTCLSKYFNNTTCEGLNLQYRTSDGSCNNMRQTFLGKSKTAYKRLLFPAYHDGINSIKEIPIPKELSTSLIKDKNSIYNEKTIAMSFWTIFIGHDLSHTVFSSMLTKNQSVECCNDNGMELMYNFRHPSCAPIMISKDDDFHSPSNRKCINYVRSMPAMSSSCTFGPREQLNLATHYLDASMVYGSTEDQTLSLRTKSLGLLSTHVSDSLMQHVTMANGTEFCRSGDTCFKTGGRANVQPHLTAMYTMWTREHNRIAIQLSLLNQHWDDERTFQETRKIITAFVQHITYSEWLPALMGKRHANTPELEMLQEGYSDMYDETEDPTVSNSFATAILPFANSVFNEALSLYTETRVIDDSLSLNEHYNQTSNYLQVHFMDYLIRGLSMQNTQKIDVLLSQTITNYLYSLSYENEFGVDIVSLAIQRSRDHGIPSYTQFRKYCELKIIKSVDDLVEVMVEGATEKLLNIYKSWDDIDLLIGVLFEKHDDYSMVGPTMGCIIMEQFIRTRLADRYFYDSPGVFNEYQLAEIRKITLARLFCDNSENIKEMQKNVFFTPKSADALLSCNSPLIPKINLQFWTDITK